MANVAPVEVKVPTVKTIKKLPLRDVNGCFTSKNGLVFWYHGIKDVFPRKRTVKIVKETREYLLGHDIRDGGLLYPQIKRYNKNRITNIITRFKYLEKTKHLIFS